MKNTIELQLLALRPPRVLKQTDGGVPGFLDIWAGHYPERSSHWAIAVKCGKEVIDQALEIEIGTFFTVKGRLDQSKNPKTGLYHAFIWAEEISDLFPSTKPRHDPPAPHEPDFPDPDYDDETPEQEIPHA